MSYRKKKQNEYLLSRELEYRSAMLYSAECWPTKKATCPATECSRDADVTVVLRAHKEGCPTEASGGAGA